jgi:imidazole glycerol phosphate synthase glutamine amidotransferase subunit
MTGIVDYDAGNIRSLVGALDEIGQEWMMVGSEVAMDELGSSLDSRLILPGVGAFGAAMASLEERGLSQPIRRWLAADRPFLGICLGLQLLYEGSVESPGARGLCFLKGSCVKFSGRLKVPAIGWNKVEARDPALFGTGMKEDWFYFVHSYHAPLDSPNVSGWADYGLRFPCAVARGRARAVQFHPEKSSKAGLELLRRWYAT